MLKWFRKLLKDEKGFTLIELMVVVVIIGILAAIAVPAFSNASDKAKVNKAKADLRTLESALAVYYAENNSYPDNLGELEPNYVKSIPEDPWGGSYELNDENEPCFTKDNTEYTLENIDDLLE